MAYLGYANPLYPPVSSIGPETHVKQLTCPYEFDLARVFSPLSSEHA